VCAAKGDLRGEARARGISAARLRRRSSDKKHASTGAVASAGEAAVELLDAAAAVARARVQQRRWQWWRGRERGRDLRAQQWRGGADMARRWKQRQMKDEIEIQSYG
jgi:hypothetical protein